MPGNKDTQNKGAGPAIKEAGKKKRLADALRQNLAKRKRAKKAASIKNAAAK